MNLYLFNDTDSAAVYGIGTYLKELTCTLEGSGINVHIVHLHSVRPKFEIEETNQVENWYIPEVSYNNNSIDAIREIEDYYRNVIYLFRLHIKDTKDLIFQFNYNNCYSLAKGLKKVFNCKTVAVIHYTKWQLELHGHLQRLRTIKTKPEKQRTAFEQMMYTSYEYEGALFKEVDRLIALSQYMKNILLNEYQIEPDKISVIPNGLEDMSPIQIPDRDALRKKWHLSDNEKIILSVGRLDEAKGLSYLIKAFRKVLKSFQDCRLMVAGSGNYDTYLQEAKDICTKLTFTGLLEKKELCELYQIVDVGIAPSLVETFGYVAVEMMMHGLPVVATATSGLNEVVDDTCGLKIPIIEHPDRVEIDINLLAEKIIYLLQHPEEQKRMGANARRRYETFYSTEIFRENMLQFYCHIH